jgi:predicted ferric reductase
VTPLWWYVARASGLVAWAALAATVVWGLFVASRAPIGGRPARVLDMHRFLGAAAVIFTAIHLAGLVADSTVHFGPSELLVPMTSRWRPGAVAWGVVGLYVLLTIELSSLAMRRLPRRVWRSIHRLGAVLFVVASVHMLQAGSDVHHPAVRVVGAVLAAVVLYLACYWALAPRRAASSSMRRSAPTTAVRAASTASGLTEIEVIPQRTRCSANSGRLDGA